MGQLAFQPETTKRSIVVRIVHDSIPEGKESFGIKLWKPIGATIARGRATGTIKDDDGPPARSAASPMSPNHRPAAPKVVIDELLPDPKGTRPDYEYVELLNADKSAVDLSGWTLDSGAECPLSGVLAPGGLYVVSNDALIGTAPARSPWPTPVARSPSATAPPAAAPRSSTRSGTPAFRSSPARASASTRPRTTRRRTTSRRAGAGHRCRRDAIRPRGTPARRAPSTGPARASPQRAL